MKFLILLISVISATLVDAQTISITDLERDSTRPFILRVGVSIANDSCVRQFYKMEIEDICFALLNIRFSNADFDDYYFPCLGPKQLDSIKYSDKNLVSLSPYQKLSLVYPVNLKGIQGLDLKEHYSLEMSFNFHELPGSDVNIYRGQITTRPISFTFGTVKVVRRRDR